MRNWGGNIDFGQVEVCAPRTVDELAETIASASASASHCRALGSRHSFNRIAASTTMIDTSQLPVSTVVSADQRAVEVSGPATYAALAGELNRHGLALANMASLPHISVAGAISTGTHGSGNGNRNLAGSVTALEVLTSDGEPIEIARGDDDFDGAVVSLGALGVITKVTLDVVPEFSIEQTVYAGPSLAELAEHVDAVFASGYSVSVFTHWAGQADQIWVKQRVGDLVDSSSEAFLETLSPAPVRWHPVIEIDASSCTEQLGIPGLWSDRLPHFQMGFTPSAGDEIQSEFFVDRQYGAAAIEAMAGIGSDIADALMVGEIRTVARDDLWMSPHSGRDSLAFHFTWHPGQAAAEGAANRVSDALRPFDVRPHWGKVFDPVRIDWAQYPKRDAFLDLVDRLDPNRVFSNDWFDSVIRP